VIYLVEEHPDYAPRLDTLVADLSQKGEAYIQTSNLTELECLVLPLRQKNQPLLDKFRDWFDSIEMLSIGRDVLRHAAQLRANSAGLKTPDAIHLATALHYQCDELWTNDDRLIRVAPSLAKNILTT